MSPRNQERRFHPEYAQELLRIAQADHESAAFLRSGMVTGQIRPENAAYLFQQAIEKSLKAVLCHKNQAIPLVHDLGILLARLPAELEPDFGYELAGLDEYAGTRRYEEGQMILSESDVLEIEQISQKVIAWAGLVCAS